MKALVFLAIFSYILYRCFRGSGFLLRLFKTIFGSSADNSASQRPQKHEQITHSKQDLTTKKKKVFKNDEGEYTEYEEVKD